MRESTMSTVRALCCSPVLSGELPAPDAQELATALKVLADPVRLRLLGLIRSAPDGRAVTRDLVEPLEVSQPTVSHHLKKLEDAGLVIVRQEGRQRFYTLNQERMTVCCGMLVRAFAPDYTTNLVTVDRIPVVGP